MFETLRIIVEPMAGYVLPARRHHYHTHFPHGIIPPTLTTCQTRRSPSAYPYRITDNCHLVSHPAQNLHQHQEGCLDRIQVIDITQTEFHSTSNRLPDKLFRATLLKAASHHIPTGRLKLLTQHVAAEILAMMEERDDIRKQDPASTQLSTMNDETTNVTLDHKRRQWREFVESIDYKTDSTKLCLLCFPQHLPLEEPRTSSYTSHHSTTTQFSLSAFHRSGGPH